MNKVKILFLEHESNDLELLQYELKKGEINYIAEVVETKEDYMRGLKNFMPDIILSDYSLPLYDGISAFKLRQELLPGTPFIFVSGMIGEENAVELIKNGATDYILKEKMYQAAPKVLRALKEARERERMQISEKQLIEYVQHIKDILENITDGFCAISTTWIVLDWNKAAEEMLGIKKQDILGRNLWEVFNDCKNLKFYEQYYRVMNEGVSSTFEEYRPAQCIWFGVSASPSKDGISVFFRDITESRRQRKLHHLENEVFQLNTDKKTPINETISFLLKGMSEIHPELIFYFTRPSNDELKENVFEADLQSRNSLHYFAMCITASRSKEEEIIPAKFEIEDLSADPISRKFGGLIASNQIKSCFSYPLLNSHDDALGTLTVFSTIGGGLRETQAHTIQKAGKMLTHIIESKLAEMTIRNSEEFRRLVMESALDAIICMNVNGEITLWNAQAEKIFGWKEEDVIGKDLASHIIPLPYREKHYAGLRKYVRVGEGAIVNKLVEVTALNAEGIEFPVELTIVPIMQQGTLTFCAFLRDISERKQSEVALKQLNEQLQHRADQLAASNAELEQFAFIASHDLQEPLRMISNFLALLDLKYKDRLDETANQYIDFAVDGAARLRKMIQDLLQFSRVGRKEIPFEWIDMNHLLSEVLHYNRSIIDERQAVVEKTTELPSVYGNQTLLQQVLQNLILNALKYQKPDARPVIRVDAKEEADCWQFSIEDNGIGIDPQFFSKIFILFQRLHKKDEYTGTGIGLSVCKKIVEGHKGKIWVESVPGDGSTFYFTIQKQKLNA
jgi:PAS domain S-box-containing protein